MSGHAEDVLDRLEPRLPVSRPPPDAGAVSEQEEEDKGTREGEGDDEDEFPSPGGGTQDTGPLAPSSAQLDLGESDFFVPRFIAPVVPCLLAGQAGEEGVVLVRPVGNEWARVVVVVGGRRRRRRPSPREGGHGGRCLPLTHGR